MSKVELHLFIIWEKADNKRGEILNDIAQNFKILDVQRVSWSEEKFSRNMSRFYGQKLPRRSFKERHCGTGPFILVIVEDNICSYETRLTSKGEQIVNTTMFDAKERYRSWTGGGHKIHATNSLDETRHDLVLLTGLSVEAFYLKRESLTWDGRIREQKRDLVGAHGWNSLEELFTVLNSTVNYVVLRNFDTLPYLHDDKLHGDIDILTEDVKEVEYIINGRKKYKNARRVHYSVSVGKEQLFFDIRSVGDDYYDARWQRDILRTKSMSKNNIYIPSETHHFYSLLYHALVHKMTIADDYRYRLQALGKIENLNRKTLANSLRNFMTENAFQYTQPRDFSVTYCPPSGAGRKLDILRFVYFSRIYCIRALKKLKSG